MIVLIECSSTLQLIAERDRLNKDLETAHGAIKSIEAELDNLQAGYGRGSQRR
jgi:cell division control protein 12